jgi:hypothetical protein
MTQTTIEPEDELPPWAFVVGVLSVGGLLALFLTLRAYSADYWAPDGANGPAAQSARR